MPVYKDDLENQYYRGTGEDEVVCIDCGTEVAEKDTIVSDWEPIEHICLLGCVSPEQMHLYLTPEEMRDRGLAFPVGNFALVTTQGGLASVAYASPEVSVALLDWDEFDENPEETLGSVLPYLAECPSEVQDKVLADESVQLLMAGRSIEECVRTINAGQDPFEGYDRVAGNYPQGVEKFRSSGSLVGI